MPKIVLEDLSPAEAAAIEAVMIEGRLRAYEELLDSLNKELYASGKEDPYYGYYIQYVIDKINELYIPIKESVDG
jgi:hypothetical protein